MKALRRNTYIINIFKNKSIWYIINKIGDIDSIKYKFLLECKSAKIIFLAIV
mgnify:FL=1